MLPPTGLSGTSILPPRAAISEPRGELGAKVGANQTPAAEPLAA
jgi:hypothetical protein